jgi:hypothetical protein
LPEVLIVNEAGDNSNYTENKQDTIKKNDDLKIKKDILCIRSNTDCVRTSENRSDSNANVTMIENRYIFCSIMLLKKREKKWKRACFNFE